MKTLVKSPCCGITAQGLFCLSREISHIKLFRLKNVYKEVIIKDLSFEYCWIEGFSYLH